jgi:fatty acid desaturase
MADVIGEFASRHKHGLCWLHIALVVGTFAVAIPAIAWGGAGALSPWRALLVFVLATLAWCQNIGLVHHFAHHLPRGPRRVGLFTARLLHAMGGLPFTRTRLAHRLHHVHLGTPLDPDRVGYQTTTTLWRRLRYLLLIGPLRARFARVDLSHATNAMSAERRAEYERRCRHDRRLVIATHVGLLALSGWYYPAVLLGLIVANVLSNVREMAEHGGDVNAAYVDIRVSPVGLLFFSTPGFWFHGIHHMDATIHYLDLPVASRGFAIKQTLPYLRRGSALGYLLTGR